MGIFSCPVNALLSEYVPYYFLLTDKITPNSIGTKITVPNIQNSNKYGILQNCPTNKYVKLKANVGIKILKISPFASILFIINTPRQIQIYHSISEKLYVRCLNQYVCHSHII